MTRRELRTVAIRRSKIRPLLQRFGIARPLDRDLRGGTLDLLQIVSRQCDGGRAYILFEAQELRRARNRDDPRLLGEQPGERDLRWCGTLAFANRAIYKWEFEMGQQKFGVGVAEPLVFDDEDIVLDAALAGMGLAYLIEDRVAPLLKAGALTRVLEDWCPPFPGFFLYYPDRRQRSPALAAFIEAIRVPHKARRKR